MSDASGGPKPKAVLVGVQLPNVSDVDHQASLTELGRLVTTLGYQVIATLSQKRGALENSTVVGEGKLQELGRLTGGTGKVASRVPAKKRKDEEAAEDEMSAAQAAAKAKATLEEEEEQETGNVAEKADKVIFDSELSPSQLRNLETATGAEVLDRTGVIVEIFHRHAKTREARIQVEIARLKYLAPRLRESRQGQDRQGGGIGAKGAGETAHELDKRRIRDRISELGRELEDIHVNQVERRQRRTEQLTVALVGYTNAGKSSLMRALTASNVLVEDKLFATLDTTIRALSPETQPRILVSDTVGFIKKLPHDLVASFRSTLDEAADASLLLYVVDAADPTWRAQLKVTQDVLAEIVKGDAPSLLVLNKIDCLDEFSLAGLKREFPKALPLSAKKPEDVQKLRDYIIAHFDAAMQEADLVVPYEKSAVLGEIRKSVRVLGETHSDTGTTLRVRGFAEDIARLVKRLGSSA